MEPQEYCLVKGCPKNKCLIYVIAILLIAFFTTLGIIIGAAVAETILASLAALITLAITFGVLLIISIILKICNKYRKHKDCGC